MLNSARQFFFVLLVLNSSIPQFSYSQILQWAGTMGASGKDQGTSVVTDAAGNVYSTGEFIGTVDFDPGNGVYNLSSVGGQANAFILKVNALGNFVWAKSIGSSSTGNAYGKSIAVDASGALCITGYFNGTVNFNGAGGFTLSATGGDDIFFLRFSTLGVFQNARAIGGSGQDQGMAIYLDASGHIYTTGYFNGAVDFNPGGPPNILTAVGGSDIFISKFNYNSGNFIGTVQLGGTLAEYGTSIAVDGSGNMYTTGFFQGTVDFDPGTGTSNLISNGQYDVFISKLDPTGNFIWAKSVGGSVDDVGRSVTIDGSLNVYVTGYFNGTVDFDPGASTSNLITNGLGDIFILKLDQSGNHSWSKAMGGPGQDLGTDISVDAAGNVYSTGQFNATADFDPNGFKFNLTAVGLSDIFFSKLDATGSYAWANAMGSAGFDACLGLGVDAAANVYGAGYFAGTIDLDIDTCVTRISSSSGSDDIFISKISQATPPVSICMSTVDSIASAFIDIIWDKTGLTGVDSFRIYREMGPEFIRVGSVPFASLSVFTDNTNGIDPRSQSYKYKISAFTGPNESLLSATHETMWLQVSQLAAPAIDLTWTNYCGFVVDSFKVYRDSTYSSNYLDWELIATVPWAGVNTYTDPNPPIQLGTPRYRIQAYTTVPCTPTFKHLEPMASTVKTAKSNSDNKTHNPVALEELAFDDLFVVYPNPAKSAFTILSERFTIAGVEIRNVLGAVLYEGSIDALSAKISTQDLPDGVYFLRVITERGAVNKKLIVSR